MIDLRNEDTYLTFEKGFLVQSNFYFKLWMKDLQLNTWKPFFEIQNTFGDKIQCFWRKNCYEENNNEYKIFVELHCITGNLTYTIHSNYLDLPQNNEMYFVSFKKKDNIFQVQIEQGQAN
jgi:hypothetical protein